jgi:hypothetical protein
MTTEASSQSKAPHSASHVRPYRIDTHQHLFPPKWVSEYGEAIVSIAPGMPTSIAREWSPQNAIEAMDKFDIPINAVVEPGCCRTPPPTSRRQQRRGPRARGGDNNG